METNWKPGDVIEFCDDQFIIIENYGNSGKVKENYENGDTINNFYWEFEGRKCKLIASS